MKKKILSALCLVLSMVLLTGCGLKELLTTWVPDYSQYESDYDETINSWEQIDPEDEDVEVTWFMDYTFSDQFVADLIYRRTGVKIKFINALNSTHDELNTMIAGNKLPDIVSVDNKALQIQLCEEGYVYAINELAKAYAPSLLYYGWIDEQLEYNKSPDGNTYYVTSHFYKDEDIKDFEELGGTQYANYSVVVRKDYLIAYINYKLKNDPTFNPDTEITKPSGFIEMCKWVKSKYKISNSTPTVCMSTFPTDGVSTSVTAMMQFFSAPQENADGSLPYNYDSQEFVDVMKFYNQLYRDHLIVSANFGYDIDDIKSQISSGRCFAFIGNPQTYRSAFVQREKGGYDKDADYVDEEHQYVSIVLTNEEGEAPLLSSYIGKGGMYQTMITKNCKRPDRVIKVIDYIMSEQGMREMIYGEVEGEYYNFTVRPGEIDPDTGKVSKYGQIEPTNEMKDLIAAGFSKGYSILGYGLGRLSPIVNPLYARLVSKYDDFAGIVQPYYWIVYQQKYIYRKYTSISTLNYPVDVTNRRAYNTYSDQLADIGKIWAEAVPQMFMAENESQVELLYRVALQKTYDAGAESYSNYRSESFMKYKQSKGVTYAWDKNYPDYVAPQVYLLGFDIHEAGFTSFEDALINYNTYVQRPKWVYAGVGSN